MKPIVSKSETTKTTTNQIAINKNQASTTITSNINSDLNKEPVKKQKKETKENQETNNTVPKTEKTKKKVIN